MSDSHAAIVAEVVKVLIKVRKQRGLSQEAVALRAGLSRSGVGHMESGRITPTLLYLLKIAEVLEVDLASALRKARSVGKTSK